MSTPRPAVSAYLPWFLLIILSLIWGSSFILMKRGLEVFAPGQVGSIRILVASLAMLPWAFQSFRQIDRKLMPYLFLVGMTGSFLPAMLFAWAQTGITSSIAGVLNALTPLFTLVIGLIIFSLPLKRLQLYGLLVGFIGSISISLVKSEGNVGGLNQYALLVVLATIFYGLNVNLIKSKLAEVRSIQLSSLALFCVGPLALGYLLATDWQTPLYGPGGWQALSYLAVLGTFGTALGLVLFNKLIQMTSAVFASSVTYLIPIVAICWGFADGERLVWLHFVGMALILLGIFLVNRANGQR